MEPRPVPNSLVDAGMQRIEVGPPPGTDPDACGTASMGVMKVDFSGREVDCYTAYFQPRKDELEALNNGGLIELQMISHVVPHSMHVQPRE
jgi:hypothetical protein